MNNEFLQQIKTRLLSQKEELLVKSAQVVEIDNDGDETDEIQANLLIGLANQLNIRDLERVAMINGALQKIKDGIYGKCEDCDEMIPEKRLLANPCFSTCVLCAEEKEREEKQRRRW